MKYKIYTAILRLLLKLQSVCGSMASTQRAATREGYISRGIIASIQTIAHYLYSSVAVPRAVHKTQTIATPFFTERVNLTF